MIRKYIKMNIELQLNALINETQHLNDENMQLKSKCKSLLDEINQLKHMNFDLLAEKNELKRKNEILDIQMHTYKEDFHLERKDRESAQGKVLNLEQDLIKMKNHYRKLLEYVKKLPRSVYGNTQFESFLKNNTFSDEDLETFGDIGSSIPQCNQTHNNESNDCNDRIHDLKNTTPNPSCQQFKMDCNRNPQKYKIINSVTCAELSPNDYLVCNKLKHFSNPLSKLMHKKPNDEPFCFMEDTNNFTESSLTAEIAALRSRSVNNEIQPFSELSQLSMNTEKCTSKSGTSNSNVDCNVISGNINYDKNNLVNNFNSLASLEPTSPLKSPKSPANKVQRIDSKNKDETKSPIKKSPSSASKNTNNLEYDTKELNDEILQCPGCLKKFHISEHFKLILHSDECPC